MVMRVMLIGLLVIGAVAMLETDVSAHLRPCGGCSCCFSAMSGSRRVSMLRRTKEKIGRYGSSGKLVTNTRHA